MGVRRVEQVEQVVRWIEAGETRQARWRSATGTPAPAKVVVADDRMKADVAWRLARGGTAMLWRGDFRNAHQLLAAMARRAERGAGRRHGGSPAELFHRHRQAQSRRARALGMLLVPFEPDYTVALRRAPDVRLACAEVYGETAEPSVASLRELLGLVGAHEWRRKGVEVPALGARIHPHYGVFSPVRGEYVRLVADAPLPSPVPGLAFDVGTGTGVLAAVLATRGVGRVLATDHDERAVGCARENLTRLGLAGQVDVLHTHLFPPGRAPLVVCNPPWLPAPARSAVDHAVYDPDSHMLRGFLDGLAEHLEPGGEGWLVLSDLAEHLGLRPRGELLARFATAGLTVAGRSEVRPDHPRTRDRDDPLHAARAAEVTSLWRLSHSG